MDLDTIRKRFSIDRIYKIEYCRDKLAATNYPELEKWRGLVISLKLLELGLRFPMHPFVQEILRSFDVPISFLTPNAYFLLQSFLSCVVLGDQDSSIWDVEVFRSMYTHRFTESKEHPGMCTFSFIPRPGIKKGLFQPKDSWHNWYAECIIVRWPERYGPGCPYLKKESPQISKFRKFEDHLVKAWLDRFVWAANRKDCNWTLAELQSREVLLKVYLSSYRPSLEHPFVRNLVLGQKKVVEEIGADGEVHWRFEPVS